MSPWRGRNGSMIKFWTIITHSGLAVAVIVAATVLAALHDIDGSAVTAIYGAALGFAGGATTAGSVVDTLSGTVERVSDETHTQTEKLDALVAGRRQEDRE